MIDPAIYSIYENWFQNPSFFIELTFTLLYVIMITLSVYTTLYNTYITFTHRLHFIPMNSPSERHGGGLPFTQIYW